MSRKSKVHLPYFDDPEQMILERMKKSGGDIFRTDLRKKIKGSNTTLVKKISSLKEKGIIEEYKQRERKSGRLKTAYTFTDYAERLFKVEKALKMEKWFSASQKIELFPEFARIAEVLMGEGYNVYDMLGIEPQCIFIETLLATSKPPSLEDKEIREVLTACNAFLQNIVTSKLYTELQEYAEGHIIFHYITKKPKEELQRLLPQYLMDYVTSSDSLEWRKTVNKIMELTIKYPNLASTMTMAASNIARSLKLKTELRDLTQKYKAFEKEKKARKSTRMKLVLSVLGILKKLYIYSNRRRTAGVIRQM